MQNDAVTVLFVLFYFLQIGKNPGIVSTREDFEDDINTVNELIMAGTTDPSTDAEEDDVEDENDQKNRRGSDDEGGDEGVEGGSRHSKNSTKMTAKEAAKKRRIKKKKKMQMKKVSLKKTNYREALSQRIARVIHKSRVTFPNEVDETTVKAEIEGEEII